MKFTAWFILLTLSAAAGLQWEQKEIALNVHPVQTSAEAVFTFSNVGKKAVKIEDISVSCGCLAPRLDSKTYTPGEKGELKIKFDLLNRTGPQKKTIEVKTDDGRSTQLYLNVDIPRSYSIAPIMMTWALDNTTPTKTAKLKNRHASPIRVHSVSSSHEAVPVVLKTIREGYEYEIMVNRPMAGKNIRSVIRVETEPPAGLSESKSFKFYVLAK